MIGGNLDQLIPTGNGIGMSTASDKAAKIRQAIYRGASTESMVKHLKASIAQVKRERQAMAELKISKHTDDLTTAQAAFLLGLSAEGKRVSVFTRNGRLPSRMIGCIRVIAKKDFLAFAAKPRPFGRIDLRRKREQKE